MTKNCHSQKNLLIFIKYFLQTKSSLNHHVTIDKKRKKKGPTPFVQPPHPTPPTNNFMEFFSNPTFLPWESTKLFPPTPPKKQTFGLIPIPNEIHLFQSFKKELLWKGVEFIHPPLLTKKKPPFGKEFFSLTPCPLFLKLHLQLVILSV